MSPKGVADLLNDAKQNAEVAKWLLDGFPKTAMLHAQKVLGKAYEINPSELALMNDINAANLKDYEEVCVATRLTKER